MSMAAVPVEVSALDRAALAAAYLPLAHKIAGFYVRHLPSGVDGEDLFGAARLGLVQAAARYDEAAGKFSSFAKRRIEGAVLDEMRRQDHLPRGDRRLVHRLERDDPMTATERDRAEAAASSSLLSLDRLTDEIGFDAPACQRDVDADLLDAADRAELLALVATLPAREWDIVMSHHFRAEQHQVIADRLGVSESRVSQILASAYRLLRARQFPTQIPQDGNE